MMEKIRLGDLVEFQRGYDLPKNEFKNGKIEKSLELDKEDVLIVEI